MNRKRLKYLLGIALIGTVVVTFKIEYIEGVCAKTGSTIKYSRYLAVLSTPKKMEPSWVEIALREEGLDIPEHEWKRTRGNTWTRFTLFRAHGRAPETYSIRNLNIETMRKEFGRSDTLTLAKEIAYGRSDQQEAAVRRIFRL